MEFISLTEACTEALAQGAIILSPEHLGIIQGALLAAIVSACAKIACDWMAENGPPTIPPNQRNRR